MSAIPALGRLRQEDHQFEVSMGYVTRPCLKNKNNKKPNRISSNGIIYSVYSVL
jgi:hypothetical protein